MKASAALALFLGAIANSAAVEVPMSQVAVSGSGIASAAAPSSPAGRSVIPVLSLSLSLPTGFENKWRAQAFSGATCSGVSIFWIAPDGSTCTNLQGVNSLMVTNKGGCTTRIYNQPNCQGASAEIAQASTCNVVNPGEAIQSIKVDC